MTPPKPWEVRSIPPDEHLSLFMAYMRGEGLAADAWERMSNHQQEYFKEIKRWKARNAEKK